MKAKLADFGLAKLHSMTTTAAVTNEIGSERTQRWMAPELLLDADPKYSTKSDMYSLGIVMWEMAANCTRPFKDLRDDTQVAKLVLEGMREKFPAGTPDDYREWVQRCWHHDPKQRPEASEIVATIDVAKPDGNGSDVGRDENSDEDAKNLTIPQLCLTSSMKTAYGRTGGVEVEQSQTEHVDPHAYLDTGAIACLHKAAGQGRFGKQYNLKPLYEQGPEAYARAVAAIRQFTEAAKQ
ncbi:hypothetical protein BGZ73_009046, partial [Actinomortierella ambigua]